jgi:hypothetical protein
MNEFDAVILNKTGNFSLNIPIYIGVYANSFSVYSLSFETNYELDYDYMLTTASPIKDSIAYYNYYTTETNESFYSFKPWWAGFENLTMVFFADVIFNTIFFYMAPNTFPQYYEAPY